MLNEGLFGDVQVCGLLETGYDEFDLIERKPIWRVPLLTRRLPKDLVAQGVKYLEWYHRIISKYRSHPIGVIHCHDLSPLPIATRLKKLTGARLVYDSHELQTETYGMSGVRQKLARLAERKLIPLVDVMITVSPSIRRWYADRYPHVPIHVLRNIPDATYAQNSRPFPLREKLKVPEESLLFIYLGGLNRGRGIETALQAFGDDRVSHHVLFMGQGPLRSLIENQRLKCTKIHYLPAVPPEDVLQYTAGADVGLCLYQDTCLNHRYCLPNKLFETISAGLPVLASNLPDQASLVTHYDAGWIIDDDIESVIQGLSRISTLEAKQKRQGLSDRTGDLTWSKESRVLIEIYRDLVQGQASVCEPA